MKTPEGWNPMENAPKDRPILVLHVHESDKFYEGKGRLTAYGAHVEALSHIEDGPYVAAWGGEGWDFDEMNDRSTHVPPWWFVHDDDWESPLAPVGWLPVPGFTKAKGDSCPGCGLSGYYQSGRAPDKCDHCDPPGN